MPTTPESPIEPHEHRTRLRESQGRLKATVTAMQTAQSALLMVSKIPPVPLQATEVEALDAVDISDPP